MSWQALAWASKWRANSAAEKLILLAYAECHNEETGVAYPSIAWLCEFSSLNRKTVIAAVARLELVGVLEDSGDRKGLTKQLKVYTVHVGKQSQKRDSAENGTVPKTVGKQSQKRDTEPVREPIPSKTTSSRKKRLAAPAFVPPSDIPEAEWNAFEEMRRRIGKPMTGHARDLAVTRLRLLAEDGYPPGAVLNHSILNNYQGLFPAKDDRHEPIHRHRGAPAKPGDGFIAALHQASGDWPANH